MVILDSLERVAIQEPADTAGILERAHILDVAVGAENLERVVTLVIAV